MRYKGGHNKQNGLEFSKKMDEMNINVQEWQFSAIEVQVLILNLPWKKWLRNAMSFCTYWVRGLSHFLQGLQPQQRCESRRRVCSTERGRVDLSSFEPQVGVFRHPEKAPWLSHSASSHLANLKDEELKAVDNSHYFEKQKCFFLNSVRTLTT